MLLRAIDAHAHLHDPRIANDLDDVVARATRARVERILSCGEDLASSERAIAVAARHPSVRVAVGVHPHRAASWSEDVAHALRELTTDRRVVAIGEIGVDLSGRSAPREAQERVFEAQLRLARELTLPVVVHVRDAGALARAVVASVGPVCSEALEAHGVAPDLEASPPKMGPLVALVAAHARDLLAAKRGGAPG